MKTKDAEGIKTNWQRSVLLVLAITLHNIPEGLAVGVGEVALSMMIPILNTMEANVSYLPTAVISNNFDYGEAVIKDLTEFMKDNKELWEKLNFQFEIIYTGILMNADQVDIVKEIVEYHDKKPLIVSEFSLIIGRDYSDPNKLDHEPYFHHHPNYLGSLQIRAH